MDAVKCMKTQRDRFNETGNVAPIAIQAGMKLAREVERLRETARLAERFARAKGRHHSQQAMCDLLEHFGLPCVRPGEEPGPVLRTPLHMTLLIRICVGDIPLPEPQRNAPATVEYLSELEEWGAIVPDGAGWYEGTALGQHWLNQMHQVPRPGGGDGA